MLNINKIKVKISFIVIGRNEGWKLTKCFQSIIVTINYCHLKDCEIIYVDSDSTDNSIEIAKQFSIIKIFKLTGDLNAAIARNVGAMEAKGNVFIFLDGDMEINKKVFLELFNESMKLKYDFISGDFCNFYYKNSDSKVCLSKEMYHKNTRITKNFTTGGLFAINKEIWELVGGMKNIFKRSQDMDLGLRLSKKGIFLYRLPINLANHHTVSYHSKSRLWSQLMDSTHLYSRSLLYRKNISNIYTVKLMVKQDYSLLFLLFTFLGYLLFRNPDLILIYLTVLIARSVFKKNIKYLLYFLIRDIKVMLGFIFFYPTKNKVLYISISNK